MRILYIRQIFVVSDDGYWVLSSLEVLSPFFQGKYDRQEFSVIDVIVLLSDGESAGEVGARVKVFIGICL